MKIIIKSISIFCLMISLCFCNIAIADFFSKAKQIESSNITATPSGAISVRGGSYTSFADIVEKVTPAIVNISTTQKAGGKKRGLNMDDPRDILRELLEGDRLSDQARKLMSLGSGFVFDPDGYVVTNFHVIDGAEEINVTFNDSSKIYKATVVGKDPKTDIAVLKINTKAQLPYLKFGDSDKARVGDLVIAIGNAFGLGETVTTGIISAKARYIDIGGFDDLIQTDAAINMGNSGGPMLNLFGEVIGVNSVILSPPGSGGGSVGVGFAIPSLVVQSVVKQLREKGEIIRGWMGVMVQPMNQNIADGLGIKGEPRGALVSSIAKGSPAERAGIKVGDVIMKFNNKDVLSMHKLPRMVGEVDIGSAVPVEVLRSGKINVLTVVIEKPQNENSSVDSEQNAYVNAENEKSIFGISVQDITAELRKVHGIDDSLKGVIVTHVERNSVAALAGIKSGDVILQLNGKEVKSADDFIALFKSTQKSGKGGAALLLSRNDKTFFIGIELH